MFVWQIGWDQVETSIKPSTMNTKSGQLTITRTLWLVSRPTMSPNSGQKWASADTVAVPWKMASH